MTAPTRLTDQEIQDIVDADIAYMNAGAENARLQTPGTNFCEAIGFTNSRFDGYVFEDGKTCWLSLVVSKQPGQGHLSNVLKQLSKLGMETRVPTPFRDMEVILTAHGFIMEIDSEGGRMMRSPAIADSHAKIKPV